MFSGVFSETILFWNAVIANLLEELFGQNSLFLIPVFARIWRFGIYFLSAFVVFEADCCQNLMSLDALLPACVVFETGCCHHFLFLI